MLPAFRALVPQIDTRPVAEIDRDIDDEIATHLAELEAEVAPSMFTPADARARAVARFGDPEVHKRRCREVALKERIMIQKINLALVPVLALALGITVWQSAAHQRQTAQEMNRLSQQLAAAVAHLPPGPVVAAAPPARGPVGIDSVTAYLQRLADKVFTGWGQAATGPGAMAVTVAGGVQTPGRYVMEGPAPMLREALTRAGGIQSADPNGLVTITRDGCVRFNVSIDNLCTAGTLDCVLRPGDVIQVNPL